jgi:hypothetical protein
LGVARRGALGCGRESRLDVRLDETTLGRALAFPVQLDRGGASRSRLLRNYNRAMIRVFARSVPFVLTSVVMLCLALPAAAEPDVSELEGHWLLEPYISALEETRSLVAASRSESPLAFTVEPYGASHRLAVTSFHEATWNAIARLEPEPGRTGALVVVAANETPFVPGAGLARHAFDLERDAAGRPTRMRLSLWGKDDVWFRRLDAPAEHFVNAMLVAGSWIDRSGGRWELTADGRLARPDGSKARYAPSIDTSEACCDYLTIDGERTGFARKDDALWLYVEYEDPAGCPISCDRTRPLEILVREIAGDRASGVSLARLALRPVDEDGSRWGGQGKHVAVTFDNFGRKPDPEVFPEPPAVVTNASRRTRCTIDGGIWSRDMVWLSADESLVAFVTHSGSSAQLEIYRTSNCRRTASAPVDAGTIRIREDRIEHDGWCEPYRGELWDCFPAAIWRLRSDGSIEHRAEESERRTRAVLGAGFTGRADVEQPWTDSARVVRASE